MGLSSHTIYANEPLGVPLVCTGAARELVEAGSSGDWNAFVAGKACIACTCRHIAQAPTQSARIYAHATDPCVRARRLLAELTKRRKTHHYRLQLVERLEHTVP